jgi:uncharacterized membrane protein YvbJ
MSYCPKCGNKVDETMVFCPHCGTSLKATPLGQPIPTPAQPYRRRDEKAEKNEKGFIGYLIGGLILITLGLFSVLQLSGYFTMNSGQSWAVMLLIIGVIIIIGAIYVAMSARKRSPQPS